MFADEASLIMTTVPPPTISPTEPSRGPQRRRRRIVLSAHRCLFFLSLSLALFIASVLFTSAGTAASPEYEQMAGVLDTRSRFSDGIYTIDGLAKMAEERGIQVLFINDHDKTVLSYGLPPFPNLISKTVEMNSILKGKAADFLQAITQAQERYKHVIIIPGSESAAFYYWTGNPFQSNLTAHNHEKRLLTVGLSKAEDYRRLPVVHNTGPLNMELLPGILPFLAAFVLASIMIVWRGWWRITGIVLAVIALLFIIDNHPFRASVYDPWHGDKGMAPYQRLIDYVNSRGGLTFWNYPETQSGVRKLGPIRVSTKPYPQALLESHGYTGFSALYGDTITITEPGNVWDTTLREHCRGYRKQPPWGVATADYHKEGESGEKFGNYQTVFLVRAKTREAVLAAMKTGRMYARQGTYPHLARLDEFSVSDAAGEQRAVMGENIKMSGNPHIHIRISAPPPVTAGQPAVGGPEQKEAATLPGDSSRPAPATDRAAAAVTAQAGAAPILTDRKQITGTTPGTPLPPATPTVKLRLIRNGSVIAETTGPLPLTFTHEDKYFQPGERLYYRMDMEGYGKIVANPIFVTFTGAKP